MGFFPISWFVSFLLIMCFELEALVPRMDTRTTRMVLATSGTILGLLGWAPDRCRSRTWFRLSIVRGCKSMLRLGTRLIMVQVQKPLLDFRNCKVILCREIVDNILLVANQKT